MNLSTVIHTARAAWDRTEIYHMTCSVQKIMLRHVLTKDSIKSCLLIIIEIVLRILENYYYYHY